MAGIIDYISKDSYLHALNPLSKMAWAFLILILSVLYTDYRYLLVIFLAVLLAAYTAGVLKEMAGAFKGLAIFAGLLFVMQVLFYHPGTVILTLLPVGRGYLPITDQGVLLGLAMALRMLSVILSFMVFLTTTRTQDILNALVERLKIPYDFSFMVLTAVRFIPTFIEELNQISDAQKARAFVAEGWNPFKKIKAYLPLAVPLVLLSLQKARQMAVAMETRGYGAGKRTCFRELPFGARDYAAVMAGLFILASGVAVRALGWGIL